MSLNPSTGWTYYKQLDFSDINNFSASYQNSIWVYSGNGVDVPASNILFCNTNCDYWPYDIRFGTTNDPTTATQLAQWYQKSGALSSNIWVRMPDDGTDTIYMFIGNTSATTPYCSGEQTFILFDDFHGGTLNANKWGSTVNGGSTVTISNGQVVLTAHTDNYDSALLYSKYAYRSSNIAVTARIYKETTRYTVVALGNLTGVLQAGGINILGTGYEAYHDTDRANQIYRLTSYTDIGDTTQIPKDTWIDMTWYYTSGGIFGVKWLGVNNKSSKDTTYMTDYKEFGILQGEVSDYGQGDTDIEYIFEHKYIPVGMPGATFGSWSTFAPPVTTSNEGMGYISTQNTTSGMYLIEDYSLDNMSYLKPAYIT